MLSVTYEHHGHMNGVVWFLPEAQSALSWLLPLEQAATPDGHP